MRLLLALLLISSVAFAQCDVKETKDEFTGATIKETGYEKLSKGMSGGGGMMLKKVNGKSFITVGYGHGAAVAWVAGVKDPLHLKLVNDSVVTIYPDAIYDGKISTVNGISTTSIYINYPISDSQLALLKSSPIKKFRLSMTDVVIEEAVKEKFQVKLSEMVSCFLK